MSQGLPCGPSICQQEHAWSYAVQIWPPSPVPVAMWMETENGRSSHIRQVNSEFTFSFNNYIRTFYVSRTGKDMILKKMILALTNLSM